MHRFSEASLAAVLWKAGTGLSMDGNVWEIEEIEPLSTWGN
jgi:hypothetical protein